MQSRHHRSSVFRVFAYSSVALHTAIEFSTILDRIAFFREGLKGLDQGFVSAGQLVECGNICAQFGLATNSSNLAKGFTHIGPRAL